jgi:(E)-4-hydroxy-3-methylbut-2-enyl-diphosphate synthase
VTAAFDGNGKGQIFVRGEVVETVPESQIVETLPEEATKRDWT